MTTIKTLPESDTAIQHEVQEKLHQHMETKAYDIKVQVKAGVVTLTGIVDNYFTRQAAQKCALQVDGVHKVVNNIKVSVHPAAEQNDDHLVFYTHSEDGDMPTETLT